ncbi:unnamed protein product [Camellia sinensis]
MDLSNGPIMNRQPTSNSKLVSNLSKMRYLDLSYNNFDEDAFKILGALPSLKFLSLVSNSMEGPLSNQELTYNLSNLEVLLLRGNLLNGTLPMEVPQLYGEILEENGIDLAEMKILRGEMEELGIDSNICKPGQYNHLSCPMCKGGDSEGKSLFIFITANGSNPVLRLKASLEPPGLTQGLTNSKQESIIGTQNGSDLFNEMKHWFLSFKSQKFLENLECYENLAKSQASKTLGFVENILVIGHSCCGGIRALMSMQDDVNSSPSDIIGLILVKNLIKCRAEDETPIRILTIRRIPRVEDSLPLYDILNQFQKGHSHMAAVVKNKHNVKDTAGNATDKNDMIMININSNSSILQKQAEGKGIEIKQQKSISTHAPPSVTSSDTTESQSPALQYIAERCSDSWNLQPKKGGEQGDANKTKKVLESLPDQEEEVIGIITMEDVLEELLQNYTYSGEASEEFDRDDNTLTLIKPSPMPSKDIRRPLEVGSVHGGNNGVSNGDLEEDKTE